MADFVTGGAVLPYATMKKGASQSPKTVAIDEWNSVLTAMENVRDFMRAQVPVNLRAHGCIPRDPSKGADNVQIINRAIASAKAASRPLLLYVDDWFYVDKAGTNWSIYFDAGCKDMAIVGNGRYTSGFVQHGTGTGNDWFGMLVDRGSNIALHNFGMYQGEIAIPSTGQHDHLIQIATFGGASDRCDVSISNLYLGKSLGDGLNFYGGPGKVSCNVRDLDIDGYGFVLKTWEANHVYSVGAMVRIGTTCYYCSIGGTSGSVQPNTTGAAVVDGTVTWSTIQGGATYRFAARSGIAFQRGYDNVNINSFRIRGVQNSGVDMESTNSGTCRHAVFSNGVVDNGTTSPDAITGKKGNTSIAFSFSGSTSLTDPSKYSAMNNITLINGSLQIAETRDARVSNVRVVQEEAPLADTSQACMFAMRDNRGLILESCQLHRLGTSAAGALLDIQGTGNITLAGSWNLEQTTAADLITTDCDSDLRFDGNFNWKYSGSSPSTKSVVVLNALNHDCDRPRINGFRGESTSGAMKALVTINTRTTIAPKSVNDISIVDNHVKPGSVSTGVYFSKQPGSTLDPNPIIQGNDFGGASLYTQVDHNDAPVTTAVFPIVDGNKQGVYTIVGTVDPTNNARAPQGTRYVWLNGDSTKWFVKKTGTNRAGWAEITGLGVASSTVLRLPRTSSDWNSFIADNELLGVWTPPTLGYGCQDATGDLTNDIGAIALTAAGTPTYQNDETAKGYPSDKSVGFDDNEADAFSSSSASLPDPSNTSYLMIVIGRITAIPAATRSLFQLSAGNVVRLVNNGGQARLRSFLVGNDAQSVDFNTTDFRCWVVQVNETADTALVGCEDFKIEPGYVAPSSSSKYLGIGAVSGDPQAAPFRALRKYVWTGAAAEKSKAQIKLLLEAFGATVAWS